MIRFSTLWTIARKELRALFDSPTAAVVLAVIFILWEFLFFRNVFLIGEASLRSLLDYLPWIALLLTAAVTMGTMAQEKTDGTFELLLTHPIRDAELVVGKWLGAWLFSALALLILFPIALTLSSFGSFDWGIVIAQYFGALGFTMVLTALGVMWSSLFKSQISSMLVTIASGFLLVIAGFEFVTQLAPLSLGAILEQLSVTTHLTSMIRGVIDLRDVWYFISATAALLSLALLEVRRRRSGANTWGKVRGVAGTILFLVIIVLANAASGRLPGRLDLTTNKKFTVSDTTSRVLGALPHDITLTLYASPKLPAQLQPALRDIQDTLKDYQRLGKGKILVETKDPTRPDIEQEAKERGVQPVQFNVIGRGEFQVQHGFLGISITHASSVEALPFIPQTDALEYQLTTKIRKIAATDMKTIRFLTGSGEQGVHESFQGLAEALQSQFETEELLLASSTPAIPEKTAALVTAASVEELATSSRQAILDYVKAGGSLLVLYEGSDVNGGEMIATPLPRPKALLGALGITPEDGIAFDLQSNETVRVGGGGTGFILPYAFWPRVALHEGAPGFGRIQSLVLPWPTGLQADVNAASAAGFDITRILSTTAAGGRQVGQANVAPTAKPMADKNEEVALGWLLTTKEANKDGRRGKIIVIGSASFAADAFVQNAPENLVFAADAIGILAEEEALATLASKQTIPRRLQVERDSQVTIVTYGNFALVLALVGAIGGSRWWRRKRVAGMTYQVTTK